ncbi:hypothetical protein OH77DRAFT_711975 [Trametes cingulata]|nr:hypothetical protein OH77DRAFT_711975 [Trametes cingulata]
MAQPPLRLDSTLGAAFIGNILAASLYGLTTLQTYIYYCRSGKDRDAMKGLMPILWLLDTLHLGLISHTVYKYAITDFANYAGLLAPTWSVLAQVIVTGVSDGIVRGLFCYRIWILSRKNQLLCLAIVISSLMSFGCSLAYPIKGFQYNTYEGLQEISWLLYFSLATTFVSDFLIASTLSVLLARRRSVFARYAREWLASLQELNGGTDVHCPIRVDRTVRTLIVYSVNTGALTTVCTLACLIAYALAPHKFIYIAFYFLLPKLLLNALLATLNARKTLREQMAGGPVSIPLASTVGSTDLVPAREQQDDALSQFRGDYGYYLSKGKDDGDVDAASTMIRKVRTSFGRVKYPECQR